MSDRPRQKGLGILLAFAAAFTLPLGFLGLIGVGLTATFLIVFRRSIGEGERRLLAASSPLAVLIVVATLRKHNMAGADLLQAIGMSVLLTAGLIAILRMTRIAGEQRVAQALLLGAAALASSVIIDHLIGWHGIPSGLFADAGLHNVAASVLVLSLPVALKLACMGPRRRLAVAQVALFIVAILVSLSWVGVLGSLVAAAVFVSQVPQRKWAWLGVIGLLTLAASTIWWVVAASRNGVLPIATLGEVLSSRFRIFAEGLELASRKPWLGWGYHVGDLSLPLGSSGIGFYNVDDLALPHFHSLYVQTLFETGLLGLTALALLFGYLTINQEGIWRNATTAALIGFFTTQLLDHSMMHSNVVLSAYLIASLGLPSRGSVPASHARPEAINEPGIQVDRVVD